MKRIEMVESGCSLCDGELQNNNSGIVEEKCANCACLETMYYPLSPVFLTMYNSLLQ